MLAKSSTELIRQRNSLLVLAALRRHGALAHTDVSDHTGLSSATVSAITADLETAGIIEKSEQQPAGGRGRPRVLLRQRRDCAYLAVVIITSDGVEYSLVDYSGRLIDRFNEQRSHDPAGAGLFLEVIGQGLERLAERSRIERDKLLIISISSKGLVDKTRPILLWSPIFGADRIDFDAGLKSRWKGRVMLANETLLVAAALGEEEEKRHSHKHYALAALSLGHSIGLGIARMTPLGEMDLTASNFGHMMHQPDGALCRCGARGCVEAYAGFYAILRTAFEVRLDTIPAKFVPLSEMDKIAQRARQGDRMAGFAFRQAGLALGNGLSRLLSLTEPMPVVITGVGTRYYDLMRRGVEEGFAQSHIGRLSGLPEIQIAADERNLVYQGHLRHAFAEMDRSIVMAGALSSG
ncbi:ROK family transcriptional regulator [Oryzifoliimicrobium ureilyticus]|uniref:ROK family transcriptional regulator n=1 Tax=Oryzifoliimicrobium ureilyticus TaxID=3113724 RepID=UPI0030762842